MTVASSAGAATPAQATLAPVWRRLLRARLTGQSAIYTITSVLVMLLGAVGKAILARKLTPTSFGTYAFAVSFLAYAAMFFEFGLYTPAARRIAHAEGAERSEFIGASLAAFVPIGALFCVAVFALSFAVKPVFGVNAGAALRVISPLAFAYAFSGPASQLAQGADEVGNYSITGLIGQTAFIVMLVVASIASAITVSMALLINTAGVLIAFLLLAEVLRPRFAAVRDRARLLVADAREWGLQLYLGRVLSIGTYNMDVLMVAAFAPAKAVGFYVLAGAFAQASGLPITGLGNALFKSLARSKRLDPRWVALGWAFGAVGVLGVVILTPVVIHVVFTRAYDPVIGLALPLALAQAVRGVTGIYNTFLSSHGRGRELRNCGLVLTGSNLVLNFGLIPPFGAIGAAWASLGALLANYAAHVYWYRKTGRAR